ncbi:iron-sulfur cluster assembly scaffold protein [Candidatus Pacearchaeota archaeon]|nr:iron-sulfur cluster assembly scaffold protein [Candidatus Pacearchaeota archaeon]
MSLSMYKEQILELYKNPNNFGELNNFTHEYHEFNQICGDEIIVQLIIENEKVKDIKFNGAGCAISVASASLITDYVKNKDIKEISKLNIEDIKKLLGIEISPGRVKCATLALETIKRAINKEN